MLDRINYDRIVREKRQKYGERCFERWGHEGGSPILLRHAAKQRAKVIRRGR